MFELTVVIKGVEGTYRHKALVYEDCNLNDDEDLVLKGYIKNALTFTSIEPESIKLRASKEFQ